MGQALGDLVSVALEADKLGDGFMNEEKSLGLLG